MNGGRHSLFGIWTDKNQNIYVASYSGRVVKQINKTGQIKNWVYSEVPWAPTGGVFDEDGNLWLLECSATNAVRVRKVFKDDFGKPGKTLQQNRLPIFLTTGFLILIGAIAWFLKKARRSSNGVAQI
ncbi:MAG TPA: hypothetical protein VNA26_04000 [Chitinophagaceae bacterium]|nr:hypothetical protein [Chitinophagaceae bacterium]